MGKGRSITLSALYKLIIRELTNGVEDPKIAWSTLYMTVSHLGGVEMQKEVDEAIAEGEIEKITTLSYGDYYCLPQAKLNELKTTLDLWI